MSKSIDATKQEQRNLGLALVLILVLLFSLDYIFPTPKDTIPSTQGLELAEPAQPTPVLPLTQAAVVEPQNTIPASVLPLKNNMVKGTVSVSSGGIDSLTLTKYRETTAPDSPDVTLLKPHDYWTTLNWTSPQVVLPSDTAVWESDGTQLTPQTPLTLTYANKDVRIERVISVDDAYMFTFKDTVYNLKDETISVALNGQINRRMDTGFSVSPVHEGFIGVFDNKLVEKKLDDVEDDPFREKTTGGWLGITEKYWQSALIFDQQTKNVEVAFRQNGNLYTAMFQTPSVTIAGGSSATKVTYLFAGAKQLSLINAYGENLGIPKFDLSIDFGWFYFLTKPFLYFLNWLYLMVGNMGVAILIFATLLRIAMLPIATKSYESMAKMRKVQPKLKALQERYKDNRMMLQQETMNLYKREKINPAGGCLPMLIQIPVFFALYKVLSVSINMRQAPFFGWIQDLSAPDPSSVFTLFGLINWPIPSVLNIGVWPLVMGITMYIQQKLGPAPADKTQANMFKMMPVIFTFMLGHFASGLVIYWAWSNVLSIIQQKYIMKKVGVK